MESLTFCNYIYGKSITIIMDHKAIDLLPKPNRSNETSTVQSQTTACDDNFYQIQVPGDKKSPTRGYQQFKPQGQSGEEAT